MSENNTNMYSNTKTEDINAINSMNTSNNVTVNTVYVTEKKEGLGIASMVMGIIALVLSIPLNILTLPLSIIGLILGIVNKAKKGKRISGIVLNSIAIFLPVVIIVIVLSLISLGVVAGLNEFNNNVDEGTKSELKQTFYDFYNKLDGSVNEDYLTGNWSCKSSTSSDYIVSFNLYNDNTFLWGKYNDTRKNYVTGTFTKEELTEKNENNFGANFYKVTLSGNEYVVNGVTQSESYNSIYEMAVQNKDGKKSITMVNENTYNTYYCVQE